MKNIAVIILMLFTTSLFAQRLKLSAEKVLENGKQIAKFEKTSDTYSVVANMDEDELWTIETLSDDELHLDYNVVSFADDNQSQAYLPYSKKLNVVETVLKANVLKDGVLNPDAIKLFCAKNTLDVVQKKPLAKQLKELTKEEKAALKAEQDEEKDFAVQDKKEKKVEAKQEKADARKEKLETRKEELEDRKAEKADGKPMPKTEVKTKAVATKNIEVEEKEEPAVATRPTITINKNQIFADQKLAATYSDIEGAVNGKKGKIYTFYNTAAKRLAVVKVKNYTTVAEIENATTKAKTIFNIKSDTDKTMMEQIIMHLDSLNLFQ
jgi:hypothetical protein